MKLKYLLKRALRQTQGARVKHADGRVTECLVVRNQAPQFGMRRRWVVLAPPGTEFNPTGDMLIIDRLPPLTTVDFLFSKDADMEEGT